MLDGSIPASLRLVFASARALALDFQGRDPSGRLLSGKKRSANDESRGGSPHKPGQFEAVYCFWHSRLRERNGLFRLPVAASVILIYGRPAIMNYLVANTGAGYGHAACHFWLSQAIAHYSIPFPRDSILSPLKLNRNRCTISHLSVWNEDSG